MLKLKGKQKKGVIWIAFLAFLCMFYLGFLFAIKSKANAILKKYHIDHQSVSFHVGWHILPYIQIKNAQILLLNGFFLYARELKIYPTHFTQVTAVASDTIFYKIDKTKKIFSASQIVALANILSTKTLFFSRLEMSQISVHQSLPSKNLQAVNIDTGTFYIERKNNDQVTLLFDSYDMWKNLATPILKTEKPQFLSLQMTFASSQKEMTQSVNIFPPQIITMSLISNELPYFVNFLTQLQIINESQSFLLIQQSTKIDYLDQGVELWHSTLCS